MLHVWIIYLHERGNMATKWLGKLSRPIEHMGCIDPKLLITTISKSPKDRVVVPLPTGLFMAHTWG